MPDRPSNYHLVHLWIDLTRTLHQMAAPGTAHFGTSVGDLLIRSAVYIGTVEGRPMSPAKISEYVGIPRGTVNRRLAVLAPRGLVERCGVTWRTPAARMNDPPDVDSAARLVQAACSRLVRT